MAAHPPVTPVSPAPAADNAAFLVRLRAGDDAAFEELIRTHGGRMLAVARRMLPREEDAQDAVQDAFLSAFKSLDRFDGRASLATWLHRITINAALMKLRTRRRRPERLIEDLLPRFKGDGHATESAIRWNPPESSGIESEETRRIVRERIEELPEQFRTVLLLRDIEELSTEQTAELLDLTTSAVKTRLHRARQALRQLLDPCFSPKETV